MPAYAKIDAFYNQLGNTLCDHSTVEQGRGSQRQEDIAKTVNSARVSKQGKDKLNELTLISSSSLRTA